MGADEQRAALAVSVLDHGKAAVVESAARLAGGCRVALEEAAAADRRAVEGEADAVADVGHELDFAFARAEDHVEAVVRLHGADLAAVAEVAGRRLRDQRAALLDPGRRAPWRARW